MPRVAMVVTSLEVGGAQRQVVDLALALGRRSWDVSVISMLPDGPLATALARAGIEVHSLGMRRGRARVGAIAELRRIVRVERPAIVHSHMIHANLLSRAALVGMATPLVNTIHNDVEGKAWQRWVQRLTRRLPELTTTVSEASLRSHLARHLVDPRTSRPVPNAIDLGAFLRVEPPRHRPGSPFEWVSLARLDRQKDLPTLIDAVADLAAAWDLRVRIAGVGPLRTQLADRIASRRLEDRVVLVGATTDPAAMFASAHGFALSSRWEGLPISLIEASASGLPCVVTDAGGSSEVVQNGMGGIVVPTADPQALAQAMAKVMEMGDDARLAMGGEGRRRAVARFDVSARVGEWDAIYRGLLGS